MIVARCKTDNLALIKNLNLWGNEISDVSLISEMPNLEVLSLSVNKISSLKDFVHCTRLQELYLRKNNISSLLELKYLAG
jgi:Leucine-rich repeat (LRR) protein